MNIIVLGGTGMLGHKMFQVLKKRFPDTLCTIRGSINDESLRRIDLFQGGRVIEHVSAEDSSGLRQLLVRLKPEVVINCIGIVKQRAESQIPIRSFTVNALLPHRLVQICQGWGGRVINISTDCVFSGKRGGYVEDDPSDAEDIYGKTKYLGEVSARNAVTLRTSIIGRELTHFKSLLEWFMRQNHSKVPGFTRAFYSGVTTNYLAEVVGNVIQDYPKLSGLYQVTAQTISKCELLCLLRDSFNLDIEVIPDEAFFSDRSMKGDKFMEATGYISPPWSELAAQLANDPTPYQSWICSPSGSSTSRMEVHH